MKEKIEEIKKSAKEKIAAITSLQELQDLKGELTSILKGLGGLAAEDRPKVGSMVNQVRDELEKSIESAEKAMKAKALEQRLEKEKIDVTMPSKVTQVGSVHPITQVIEEVKEIFLGMGYSVADGPEVERTYYVFDQLNTPIDHPARDLQDTFYVTEDVILRTQTSSVQIRAMENQKPPIKMICPGAVYRSDTVDATHSPLFHQIEGLVVDKNITMTDLKGTLEMFAKNCLGPNTKIRFRPHHFPYTEPSAEADVSCFVCGGKGCRVCKNEGWIELLGCGMVHPKVLENCGIDPNVYSGFAFGFGVERIAMAKFGIDDMRLLFENDVRFLKQF